MITIETVVKILNENATGQINFSYDGIPIYGGGFRSLAQALQNGHINLGIESNRRRAMLMRLTGSVHYNHENNTLVVHSMDFLQSESIHDKALLIHEMTHALTDYQSRTISKLSSESVAYIAQMMYVYRNGYDDLNKLAGFLGPLDPRVAGVLQAAWNIAKSIATTRGGYLVSNDLGQALRVAILSIPNYRNADNDDIEFDGLSFRSVPS